MKIRSLIPHVTCSSLILAIALALGSSAPTQAEPPAGKMMETTMKEHCQAMVEHQKQMKATIVAQDAELNRQIGEMNRATGDKKVELMASIITLMGEQRTARAKHQAMMDEALLKHMAEHMEMGKDSLAQCPMMGGMKEMGAKPTPAQK